MSTKLIARAIVRWSWLLVLCLIAGWLGGKLLATLLPPTYQGTAIVQLNAQSRTSQVIQSVSAYASLVTGDSILGTALKDYPNLDRQSVGTKGLTVTPDIPSQTISIQVALPSADDAVSLSNRLAQLLITQENTDIKSQYAKQLQILNSRIAEEQKAIDSLNQKISQAPPASPTTNTTVVQQYQNQVSQEQSLQNQDISARQTLLTEQALFSAPLSIVQAATKSTKPSSILGLIPWTPLAIVLLLALGIVLIYWLEKWSDRVNSVYTLQKKVGIPILGALRWAQQVPLRELCSAKTPYAEDCRVMMADVLFQAEEARASIIAITSIRSGAGTSSVASQLGALLAQSKRQVLLIDANLYQPKLHEQLKITNEAGLAMMLEEARNVNLNVMVGSSGLLKRSSGELADRLPLDNFVRPTTIPNLYIIPAGKPKMNPSDLLSMPVMGDLLKRAARPVDFVVIDCPALNRGDAHVLGALSDQTLVVVDATKDRVRQVINTKDELMNTGVKVFGLIVNKLGRLL